MTEIVSRTTYMPVHRNDYVQQARGQLQNLAISGAIAVVLSVTFRQPTLLKAGVAIGIAGFVGLTVLAAFEQ